MFAVSVIVGNKYFEGLWRNSQGETMDGSVVNDRKKQLSSTDSGSSG